MTTDKQDRKEGRSANIGFAKWRVHCFYDSLVQGSTFGTLINICANNPPLRKAEKRYGAVLKTDNYNEKTFDYRG